MAIDTSVFKTVAIMMQYGYMPYKDTFDHKGPLIYIINYIGNKISYYRGVWCIEFIFLVITLFLMYKIARMFTRCSFSYLVVFVSIIPLFTYFPGGNMTEEYAMPFIAAALYIFTDYQIHHETTDLKLIVCGFCLGGVLMLRPNMISAWIVFIAMIGITKIINRN